jgi:hypothetical protein
VRKRWHCSDISHSEIPSMRIGARKAPKPRFAGRRLKQHLKAASERVFGVADLATGIEV